MLRALKWMGGVLMAILIGCVIYTFRDNFANPTWWKTTTYSFLLSTIEPFYSPISLGHVLFWSMAIYLGVGFLIELYRRSKIARFGNLFFQIWLMVGAVACLAFGGLWKIAIDSPRFSIVVVHPSNEAGNYESAAEIFKSDFADAPVSIATFHFQFFPESTISNQPQLANPFADDSFLARRLVFLAPCPHGYPADDLEKVFPDVDAVLFAGKTTPFIPDNIYHVPSFRLHVSDHEEAKAAVALARSLDQELFKANLVRDGSTESEALCSRFDYWLNQYGLPLIGTNTTADLLVACGGVETIVACGEYLATHERGVCFVPAEFTTESYLQEITLNESQGLFFVDPVPEEAEWRKTIARHAGNAAYQRHLPDVFLYVGAHAAALDFREGKYKMNGVNTPVPWIEIRGSEVELPASTTGWINTLKRKTQ